MFFGPGIRYVPEAVWRSKFFWIGLVVVIIGSILYHNKFFMKNSQSFNHAQGHDGAEAAKVSYSSDGRSGHVHFQSAEAAFSMYYEFSGGDCVVSINIPSVENWKKHTKLPLARREEVLDFIGQQVVKDQTTGGRGYFKIEGNWLNIYA